MKTFKDKIAVITGASSGIGKAIALDLSAKGVRICLLGRKLEKLEEVAQSFAGVEKSFAIQAGREVRILVEPEKIDDVEASKLARDISKKIEAEVEYPGQIRVTVIRETRATEYAR